MKRHSDHIVSAMKNHGIVAFLFISLALFGIIALPRLNKDEFPQFTIRQGIVAAIYPGATADEVEAQVTRPLEDYINTFSEVDKAQTYSITEDGIVYVYVTIRNSVDDNQAAWTRIRAGLDLLKKTQLPAGVLETVLIDDFGNTSSMLLAVESKERTPRELEHYAAILSTRLREIPETGNIRILGKQQEEIAVTVNPERLSRYHLHPEMLRTTLMLEGTRTMGGESAATGALQVVIPYQTEYALREQIIRADMQDGTAIRLGDVADVTRRYRQPKQFVRHYEHTDGETHVSSALIISIEMVPGNNIVAYGTEVENALQEVRAMLPPDLQFHRITDQPRVVDLSVRSFLRDILISILVVIGVMLVLFPLRTALVASTGVPICIAICWGMMYLTGIEVNTVTLAALIFVLGMIVDDSVIVIDGYSNLLEKGHSRWYSAAVSTRQLFVPMTLATCSISGMFFPMTKIIQGPLGEFVQLFPFAVLFALGASIFYAGWVTPYLSTCFIKRHSATEQGPFERLQQRFFAWLQQRYEQLLDLCFRRRAFTYSLLIGALAIGLFFLTRLNLQLLPKAERECLAVEIHLRQDCSIQQTAQVADSLARILAVDPRIVSVTSFVGQASPRFHATYTPNMASPHYAQFIVDTRSQQATAAILKEYSPRYENYFPEAYVRFKQLDYQVARNPLEVRFKGEDMEQSMLLADSLKRWMSTQPELQWVHSDFDATSHTTGIRLKPEEATRLGISEAGLSLYLSTATSGSRLTTVWEDDYGVPVMLYTTNSDSLSINQLRDLMVPTAYPGVWVSLRQVATLQPAWHRATIERRNGIRTVTVGSDLRGKTSQVDAEKKVKKWIATNMPQLPEGTEIEYGGLSAINGQMIPQILWSVVAALLVMFVLMLYHFGKVSLALLALSSSLLCIFGAFLGLWLFDLDISITAVLGIVSLIGIIVRNAIMMYEYAEELRKVQHLPVREAAYQAGLRRMRPVFLTSATTALGVIPMIIAHTSLWMPMGVVICFGTIFTLPLTITILPVLYWRIYE